MQTTIRFNFTRLVLFVFSLFTFLSSAPELEKVNPQNDFMTLDVERIIHELRINPNSLHKLEDGRIWPAIFQKLKFEQQIWQWAVFLSARDVQCRREILSYCAMAWLDFDAESFYAFVEHYPDDILSLSNILTNNLSLTSHKKGKGILNIIMVSEFRE